MEIAVRSQIERPYSVQSNQADFLPLTEKDEVYPTNKIAWFCFVCLFACFFFYPHGKSLFICLEITSLYELEALPWWKVAQRLNSKGGRGG